MTLTPRENFHRAMSHEAPERLLIDMGKHIGSVHKRAWGPLRALLADVAMQPAPPILDRMAQTVVPDEALLQRLHIDFRWLVPHWVQVRERTDTFGYVDMWGVPYRATDDGDHCAVDGAPLRDATLADLERYAWPDPHDQAQFHGLRDQARRLFQQTGYVIGADAIKAGPLMIALQMRGYDQFFMDLVADQEFAGRLMDKITAILKTMWSRYLAEVGEFVQIAYVTDDLGTQTSTYMSPKTFRAMVKPRMKELYDHIKSQGPVRLMMHSDGAIGTILDDFPEMNVDIVNPVQTSVRGLEDTAALKRRFGDRLSFHGAIDVQQFMPNATPAEVRWEVARRLQDLGTGGGFILAPCHNLGPDIPPENIVTLFDAAHELGRYPLALDEVLATRESYFARHVRA